MSGKPSSARSPRAPEGLRAAVFSLEGDEFLLLEWPLRRRPLPARLTPAERQVAELLLAGCSNAEIARRRATRVRTVANQVASVYAKLGVGSRSELFALVSGGRPRSVSHRG